MDIVLTTFCNSFAIAVNGELHGSWFTNKWWWCNCKVLLIILPYSPLTILLSSPSFSTLYLVVSCSTLLATRFYFLFFSLFFCDSRVYDVHWWGNLLFPSFPLTLLIHHFLRFFAFFVTCSLPARDSRSPLKLQASRCWIHAASRRDLQRIRTLYGFLICTNRLLL